MERSLLKLRMSPPRGRDTTTAKYRRPAHNRDREDTSQSALAERIGSGVDSAKSYPSSTCRCRLERIFSEPTGVASDHVCCPGALLAERRCTRQGARAGMLRMSQTCAPPTSQASLPACSGPRSWRIVGCGGLANTTTRWSYCADTGTSLPGRRSSDG